MSAAMQSLGASLADRYRVERELGRGGMATVFLARDLKHDRDVAIKLLDPELGAVLGAERFLSEIRVTANLQHPNLLPLFDSGSAAGLLYYVMPYVDGESLRARLDREKQLPVEEALRLATALAGALDYAHGHGVIHRDLKPENILLQAGQPVIADFGIALAVSNAGGQRVTQTGLSLGTPQYMSPEQATGDRTIDARTDLYSLGAMLYEMLAGEPPHTGSTAQAIIAKLMTETPRSLRLARATVPPHVDEAVHRALEKLPADRFATAREFAEALRRESGTHRPGSRASRPETGRRWSALGAAMLALGTAIGWFAHRAPPAPRTIRFAYAGTDSTHPTHIYPWPAAISRDGDQVAYAVETGATRQLYLLRTDRVDARPIPGTTDGYSPAFSPDGQWLAFENQAGRLMKVRLDGAASPVAIASANNANGLDWTPDGDLVLGAEQGFRGLSRVSGDGGDLVAITHPDSAHGERDHLWPVVFHDGRLVAFSIWRGTLESAQLAVASLADGTVTPLGIKGIRPVAVVDDDILVYVEASGGVRAVRLTRGGRAFDGPPVTVHEPVVVEPGLNGNSAIYISSGGALVTSRNAFQSRLSWIAHDGTLRPVLPGTRYYDAPAISPDGQRIAVTVADGARSDVWLYDLSSATFTRLTSVPHATQAHWTSDGRRLVFAGRAPNGAPALFSQPADGSMPARLIAGLPTDVAEIALTDDDREVVYSVFTDTWRVFRVRTDSGARSEPILSGGTANEQLSGVSPDRKWMLLSSDGSGTNEVYAIAYPGMGARIQISAGGGRTGVFSRDGSRVYYFQGRTLMVARVATTPAFRVLARDTLVRDLPLLAQTVDAPPFDVSPDGTRFLGLVADGESYQLVVAPNWLGELRRTLATTRP